MLRSSQELFAEFQNKKVHLNVVLTGAPYSGKTTTLNALKEKLQHNQSYRFIDEIAMKYIHEQQNAGVNPFADLVKFENVMIRQQTEIETQNSMDGTCTIIDRSMLDHLAISEMLEVGKKENVDVIGELEKAAHKCKYDLVFILDRLPFKNTVDRMEKNESEAVKQEEFIRRTYDRFRDDCGYKIISIPVSSIEERVNFIYTKIREFMNELAIKQSASVTQVGLFQNREAPSPTMRSMQTPSSTMT